MATANFVCQKCGAALGVPPDPSALAARCAYCGIETMLPPQLLAMRQQAMQSPYTAPVVYQPITAYTPLSGGNAGKGANRALWMVLILTLIPLIFAGGIMWFVSSTINSTMKSVMPLPHRR